MAKKGEAIAMVVGLFGKRKPQNFVKRATRVSLQPLHRIVLEIRKPNITTPPFIQNISFTGMGLRRPAQWPVNPGGMFEGLLSIDGQRFQVDVRVVHITGELIGCNFEFIERKAVQAIGDYLKAELNALDILKVPTDHIQQDQSGYVPHWFLGQNERDQCELFFLSDGDKVKRFHLVVSGNYLEGGDGVPLKCGLVVNEQQIDKPSYKGSSLIQWHSKLDNELVKVFIRFISNVTMISPAHKASILKLLNV